MASNNNTSTSTSIAEEPSICIKYSRTQLNGENITWQFIKSTFEYALRANKDDQPCHGCVKRVDRVFKKDVQNGHPYMTIFIHMNFWPDNKNAQKFKNDILNGSEKIIYYSHKWFWKVVKSDKPQPNPTPFIPFIANDSDSDSDSDNDNDTFDLLRSPPLKIQSVPTVPS